MGKIQHVSLLVFLLLQTGCGLLLGNVRPVDEKSETYGVLSLTSLSPDWKKLARPSENGAFDVAYQSEKTASVISLNSACRATVETQEKPLSELSTELLMGITDISLKEQLELTLQTTPALQTTIQGSMNNEKVMIRSIVLRKATCVYDLMYIARPETFASQEETFTQFVASLRLKD